jgi:hypothetical protein
MPAARNFYTGDNGMDTAAERLLEEFRPTEDEASFIREQGRAVFAMVLKAYGERRVKGLRPTTVEMAIAYPSLMAGAWARQTEQNNKTPGV